MTLRFKVLLWTLALPLLTQMLVACCDKPAAIYKNYTYCTVLTNIYDNNGSLPSIAAGDTLNTTNFEMSIQINQNENTCYKSKLNFVNAAYATSVDCNPDIIGTFLDTIVSLSILTLNDLDSNHAKGSIVNDLFDVINRTVTPMPLNDFISLALDPNNMQSQYALEGFSTLAFRKPESKIILGKHQFEVRVSLSDGRILKALSNELVLRN